MHAPGPYGRGPSSSDDLVNEGLLEAVGQGMPALRAYAREDGWMEPDADEIADLLGSAELQLDYVDTDRARELAVAIEGLRGQLAVVPARLAVAA